MTQRRLWRVRSNWFINRIVKNELRHRVSSFKQPILLIFSRTCLVVSITSTSYERWLAHATFEWFKSLTYIYNNTTTQFFSPEKRKNIFKVPNLLCFVLKSVFIKNTIFFNLRACKEFVNSPYSVAHLHFLVFNSITKSNYAYVQLYLYCNTETQQEFMHSPVLSQTFIYTKLLKMRFRRNFWKG